MTLEQFIEDRMAENGGDPIAMTVYDGDEIVADYDMDGSTNAMDGHEWEDFQGKEVASVNIIADGGPYEVRLA